MNATRAPSESRPATTAVPPAQSTTSVPIPAISPIRGARPVWMRTSARLRRRYSALARAKSARAFASSVYARTTAIPARYSCTRAESTPSWSCAACVRSLSTTLKRRPSSTRTGYGAIAQSVSQGSTASIATSTPPNAKTVPARLTRPKPTSDFTAATSLDARAMRSPVGRAAKCAGGNVWRAV